MELSFSNYVMWCCVIFELSAVLHCNVLFDQLLSGCPKGEEKRFARGGGLARGHARGGGGVVGAPFPDSLCDIPSRCCSFGGILALRATFRLCSPRRAPRHAPWKHP